MGATRPRRRGQVPAVDAAGASASVRALGLSVLMALVGVGLMALDTRWGTPSAPIHLYWWALLPASLIGDNTGFLLEVKEENHTFTISELALILGCVFASPATLIVSRVAATVLLKAVHRRQPMLRFLFNLSLVVFETATVLTAVHLVGGRPPTDWVSWPMVLAAVTASELLCGLAVLASMRWQGASSGIRSILVPTVVTSAINVNLGLLAALLLWRSPAAIVLLVVVLVAIAATYRGYANLKKRYASLKHLYDFTRVVGADMSAESVLQNVLGQARHLLSAERAELVLLDEETGRPALHQEDSDTTLGAISVLEPDDPRCGWVALVRDAGAIVVPRGTRNSHWAAMCQELGVDDFILAPLRSHDRVDGALLVANRLGDASTFDTEDGRLFETLANHATVAFQNSRLMQQLRTEAERRRREALHDALTGLPNRTLFAQRVAEGLEQHGGAALMLLDLDRFKEVNDTLGHHNGDILLCETASRLLAALRPQDTPARLGGDEFAILMPGLTDPAEAVSAAQAVVEALERPFMVEQLSVSVGASIGIALAPEHGRDAITLLQRADVAMYQAKASPDDVVVYARARDTYSPSRLTLASELRDAIQDGRLLVYHQPKALLSDGTVIGTEALVRWDHPTRGLIQPDDFIPVAEQTGLISELTARVLSESIDQCSRWLMAGHHLGVAVNLSVRSLLDPDLPTLVANLLRDRAVPASCLTLEITESSIMSDSERAVAVLERLAAAGVRLSVDDFGTGYSSLTYLQRLPVDEVKIDKGFVFNVAVDPADAMIVQSIVELGHNLGLSVVAEGVEDQIGWDRLRAMGCDAAQGYHLSKAVPAGAVTRWLDERRIDIGARNAFQLPPTGEGSMYRLPA